MKKMKKRPVMKINYKKSPEMAIILLLFASGVFCTFFLIKMGHPRSLFSFFTEKRRIERSKSRKLEREAWKGFEPDPSSSLHSSLPATFSSNFSYGVALMKADVTRSGSDGRASSPSGRSISVWTIATFSWAITDLAISASSFSRSPSTPAAKLVVNRIGKRSTNLITVVIATQASSETRCCNKTEPNFYHKWPKK